MSRRISSFLPITMMLLGCAGFAAYRGGWIPLEFGGTPTGSVIEATSRPSGADQPPEFEPDELRPFDVSGAAVDGDADQREPSTREEPPRTNDSSKTSVRPTKWDELLNEADNFDNEDLLQRAVAQNVAPRTSGRLRFVSEEQPVNVSKEPDPSASPNSEPPAAETEGNSEPPVRIAKRSKEQEPAFDFTEIDRQIKAGQAVEAHKTLSKLYWQQPALRSHVQERIDLTAKAIYFSPQPHIQEPYVVQAGDQLRKIAVKHHIPWQYLARLNRTDPKRLREGQKLKVIDGPFGAVVTLTDFELTLHHGGQYVRSYPCCIGKNNSTPTGKFKVLNKVTSPQYTDPDGKVFSGTDPKNPLGSHWIDLGDSYGIHGTIEPDSIGKAESRGCIRLLNADVSEVYDLLDIGSEVVIRQ